MNKEIVKELMSILAISEREECESCSLIHERVAEILSKAK